MLMRRATASVSFRTQVVLVYLHGVYLQYISSKIHSTCPSPPKIAKKNHLKPIFWGFKVVQGHRCWYPRKARQQCFWRSIVLDSEIVFCHPPSPTYYEPMGRNASKTSTFLFLNFGLQNFQGL